MRQYSSSFLKPKFNLHIGSGLIKKNECKYIIVITNLRTISVEKKIISNYETDTYFATKVTLIFMIKCYGKVFLKFK